MRQSQLKSNLYTLGKFGKSLRETLDTDTLYNNGKTKAKITVGDITDDYCKIHCRDIWYMDGFIRTSNIKHVTYQPSHNNHLFKDDTLYISYDRAIKPTTDGAFTTFNGADFHISGNDIVNVVSHIGRHGLPDVQHELQHVKTEIKQKAEWFRLNHPDEYERIFRTTEPVDVFKHYRQTYETFNRTL